MAVLPDVSRVMMLERFVEAQRLGRVGSWAWDVERGVFDATPELSRILGVAVGDRTDPVSLERLVHADDRASVRAHFATQVAARAPFTVCEFRIASRGSRAQWVVVRAAFRYDAGERLASAQGTLQDVTERRELEEQLRRAQRMETLGHLASGVAHDFNNLLTVIQVELDLLQHNLAGSAAAHAEVVEIRAAAARAASLTRQLQAFSPKQILRPRVLCLNALVSDTSSLLRRLIGEDTAFVADLASDLPLIAADPAPLQQVLINLVLNERDAMPSGGTLRLSTSSATIGAGDPRLSAGAYCVLTISNDGQGAVDAERGGSDSFFTTKSAGKARGLALSAIIAVVEQLGGRLFVSGDRGRGGTFTIFLPSFDASAPGGAATAASSPCRAQGIASTVLLVEDERPVRDAAQRVLEGAGYTVLSAADGLEAQGVAERFAGPIDLLVTDIVLPGLDGRATAERVLRRRPGMRVLYMTGYTEEEIVRRGLFDREMPLLEKPFTATTLVEAVCALVETPRPGRAEDV